MSQQPGEQPQQPQQPQPFGHPPPPPVPPQVPPAAPPQPAPGRPQAPPPGVPVAGNPYAQPGYAEPGHAQPGYAQPGGPQPSPYGGYPPPHGPLPGGPGQAPGPGQIPGQAPGPVPPGQTPGPGKRRTGLIVTAAVVALAVVAGGVWFAVGRGDDAPPAAKESPSASPSGPGSGSEKLPTVQPPSEESQTPDRNPYVPEPTGTGLQAVWKGPASGMLALGDAYVDEPARVNAILSDGDGFECKGRWQKDESGDFLEVALLCRQDGARVEDKDRVGNLSQNGDTLTVKWNRGATGSETFERFRDMDPA
ncbi:hypothetical protein ACF1FX_08580 [Streptomyces sp. NPDC014646]|uniref:hypothetical protein n=1 Tax=Streptomyces sp. NPDC014646 TaxID=3364877 RepID=UPI0036F6E144